MSTIESAEELNQPRDRFSNTGAMIAKVTELVFVRCAVASFVLARARAFVLSGLFICAVAAHADNVETSDDADASGDSEESGSKCGKQPRRAEVYAAILELLRAVVKQLERRCRKRPSANSDSV